MSRLEISFLADTVNLTLSLADFPSEHECVKLPRVPISKRNHQPYLDCPVKCRVGLLVGSVIVPCIGASERFGLRVETAAVSPARY